jgi:Raf kinase inhibitor-like YbhB/YbcL family protein
VDPKKTRHLDDLVRHFAPFTMCVYTAATYLQETAMDQYRVLLPAFLLMGIVDSPAATEGMKDMNIVSPAFNHMAMIPTKYTCEGADISPPLNWSAIPADTKSLVLIVDDPDAPDPAAPRMTWVHWVLYDIPPVVTGLADGATVNLPDGIREGINDFRQTRYGGPCPPVGKHRYFFKVYALDKMLGAIPHVNKADVEKAMRGHILMKAELVGLYQKSR